jgi:hypothetical protein
MDPYLENPTTWQGTHNALITLMRGALNQVLPPPYVATTEVRCYIEYAAETMRPDFVVKSVLPAKPLPEKGSLALEEPFSPALDFQVYPVERREAYLTIRNVTDDRRVVTCIELLSPTNKSTHDTGHALYREKQRAILESDVYLIEIDLLRAGAHTVAIPASVLAAEPPFDYLICLHRARAEGKYTFWLNRLEERLPLIRVPLEADLPDVPLDVQAVFDRNYEEGAYALTLDYTQEPVPPLKGEQAAWADALLRAKGLRS